MYKSTDQIYIVSTRTGYIPQLRMYGPIPNPISVPISLCLSMLTAGVKIHQFDPKTKKVIELTVANLNDDTKFDEKPTVAGIKDLEKSITESTVVGGVQVQKESVIKKETPSQQADLSILSGKTVESSEINGVAPASLVVEKAVEEIADTPEIESLPMENSAEISEVSEAKVEEVKPMFTNPSSNNKSKNKNRR